MDSVPAKKPRSAVWLAVAVVVVAAFVGLGLWSRGQLGRLLDRQEAVRRLQAMGCRVHWDCHLFRNGEIYYVTDVNIDRQDFPDEGFRFVREVTYLKCLKLFGPRFTDDSLPYVAELPDLKYLVLQDTRVTPEGIATLKARQPELEVMVPPARPRPSQSGQPKGGDDQ